MNISFTTMTRQLDEQRKKLAIIELAYPAKVRQIEDTLVSGKANGFETGGPSEYVQAQVLLGPGLKSFDSAAILSAMTNLFNQGRIDLSTQASEIAGAVALSLSKAPESGSTSSAKPMDAAGVVEVLKRALTDDATGGNVSSIEKKSVEGFPTVVVRLSVEEGAKIGRIPVFGATKRNIENLIREALKDVRTQVDIKVLGRTQPLPL